MSSGSWAGAALVLTLAALPALAHPPPDETLAELEARLAADPADPRLYLQRAALRSHAGEVAAALADCAAARRLFGEEDPDRSLADLAAADVLLAAGRAAEAAALLDAFLAAAPEHAPARVLRARALARLGRHGEAASDYRRAVDEAPGAAPDLYLELAAALRAAGRPGEALTSLGAALGRLGRIPALEAVAAELAAELDVPAPEVDPELDPDGGPPPRTEPPGPGSRSAAPVPDPVPIRTHPGAPRVVRGPYLQLATPGSVVVRWRTDSPAHRRVRFGPAGGELDRAAGDGALATEHEVVLTGLTPETRYAYAVEGATDPAGSEPTFLTPPVAGADRPVRVWVVGDSGTANADARAVRDAYRAFAADRSADLWLMLGDNAYDFGTDAEYQAAVFDTYPEELATTPLWPTLGNHDAFSADSATGTGVYYDAFTLPLAGEAGGVPSGTEAYYSFEHGPVHFVCLDSQGSDRSRRGAMLTWLRADLAAARAPWIVAFWHHPPYSKGSHDSDVETQLAEMRERVLPILERFGVDLVLAGHSHSYERSVLLDGHYGPSWSLTGAMVLDPGDGRPEGGGAYEKPSMAGPREGALYAVAGSSGRLGGGALDHPVMSVSLRELGSLVLDFAGRRLEGSFVGADGAVADTFTLLQGPPPPPAELLTDDDFPGFRFGVVITGRPGEPIAGAPEAACLPETLCVSGALAGRTEVLLRIVGPKPNGYLWPSIVKLTTSRVEVWIEQVATGEVRYYLLEGASRGDDRLPGLFDRHGFLPTD